MQNRLFIGFVFIIYAILVFRVFNLAVNNHREYNKLAKNNATKKIPLVPIRGVILDRNGTPLAINELRFDIAVKPHLKGEELNSTLNDIASLLDENYTKIYRDYKKFSLPYVHHPISVVNYLKEETIYRIAPVLSLNSNIVVLSSYLRKYPLKEKIANVIGYVSKANVNDLKRNPITEYTKISGKRGIEKYYDKVLQGELGYKKAVVNARNKILHIIETKPSVSHKLVLSIDSKLQSKIYDYLMKTHKKAAVVVMRTNGEVLALVSTPSYDNNMFVKGISVDNWNRLLHNLYKPLLNKPISGLYPPGSTVKPAEGLIAASSGKWNPWTKVFCPGYIKIGNRKFRDWKIGGHGYVDMIKAIKRSVDVYYYKIGLKLGINYIASHLRRMGFGEKTGIDLPHEKNGIVPDKLWKMRRYHKPWFIGETLNAVIGQGYFLATPIQVAVDTALIATAKLPKPFVVKKIDENVTKPFLSDVLSKAEKKNLWIIRKGMWEVCNSLRGTAARHLHIKKIKIAGKTGTAQVYSIPQEVKKRKREDELAYFRRSHAWLTTYGPYKNPQFVVTVLVEHGGHGGGAGGDVVSMIYNYLVEKGYIK